MTDAASDNAHMPVTRVDSRWVRDDARDDGVDGEMPLGDGALRGEDARQRIARDTMLIEALRAI